MNKLTQKQLNVLNFVIWFKQIKGFPPTRAEIAAEFRYRSDYSADCHLRAIQKKGFIVLEHRKARGITVLQGKLGEKKDG